MVKKVSLYKMLLKNFVGKNANVIARKNKEKRRKITEKVQIKAGAERLRKAGYTGNKLKKYHKEVKTISREDKMRNAISKHLLAKSKKG